MKKRSKAEDFLRAMNTEPVDNLTKPSVIESSSAKRREKAVTRIGLKHIGGYFDPETVERIAVLRARLDLNNSELIKLAIDELHRKHKAQRAFGDA
jgi:hypothetical protein